MNEHKDQCAVCGDSLSGALFSVNKYKTPLAFSQANFADSNVSVALFSCGSSNCNASVCFDCIAKLEQKRVGSLFSRRKQLICPKCSNPFGEGGADLLLKGWLPKGISTDNGSMYKYKSTYKFVHQERFFSTPNILIPSNICILCMSESAPHVLEMPFGYKTHRGSYRTRFSFHLCTDCYSIMTHPAIASPGYPYTVIYDSLVNKTGFSCANRDLMDLVMAQNAAYCL